MNTYRPGPCNEMDHILASDEPFTYCTSCGHIFKVTEGDVSYGDYTVAEQHAGQCTPEAVVRALNAASGMMENTFNPKWASMQTEDVGEMYWALEEITL